MKGFSTTTINIHGLSTRNPTLRQIEGAARLCLAERASSTKIVQRVASTGSPTEFSRRC